MMMNSLEKLFFICTSLSLSLSLSLSSTLETWEGVDFYKVVVVQELYNIMDKEPSNLFHMYRSYVCR
jgi:hypothetical protein